MARRFHLRREGCLGKGASRQPLKCPKDHFCILTARFDERTSIRKHNVKIPSSDRARKCVEQQGRMPVCRSIGSPPQCPLVFGSRILYLGPYVFFVFRSQATKNNHVWSTPTAGPPEDAEPVMNRCQGHLRRPITDHGFPELGAAMCVVEYHRVSALAPEPMPPPFCPRGGSPLFSFRSGPKSDKICQVIGCINVSMRGTGRRRRGPGTAKKRAFKTIMLSLQAAQSEYGKFFASK